MSGGGDGEGVGGTQGSAHSDDFLVESVAGVVGGGVDGVVVVALADVDTEIDVGEGVGGMQGSAHKVVIVGGLVVEVVGGEMVGVRVVVVEVVVVVGDGVGGMQGSAHKEVVDESLVPEVVGGVVVGVRVVVVEVFVVVVVGFGVEGGVGGVHDSYLRALVWPMRLLMLWWPGMKSASESSFIEEASRLL